MHGWAAASNCTGICRKYVWNGEQQKWNGGIVACLDGGAFFIDVFSIYFLGLLNVRGVILVGYYATLKTLNNILQ